MHEQTIRYLRLDWKLQNQMVIASRTSCNHNHNIHLFMLNEHVTCIRQHLLHLGVKLQQVLRLSIIEQYWFCNHVPLLVYSRQASAVYKI